MSSGPLLYILLSREAAKKNCCCLPYLIATGLLRASQGQAAAPSAGQGLLGVPSSLPLPANKLISTCPKFILFEDGSVPNCTVHIWIGKTTTIYRNKLVFSITVDNKDKNNTS